MGGGMLGYQLARSGRKVLLVEKVRSTLPGTPGTMRAAIPKLAEPRAYYVRETRRSDCLVARALCL
jgi:choline dehydrogenase-like flavoprotein